MRIGPSGWSSKTSADTVTRSVAIAFDHHTLTRVAQAEYFRHLLKLETYVDCPFSYKNPPCSASEGNRGNRVWELLFQDSVMQGDHGYYGGRDSPPQGYGYGYGGGYGYDAGAYGSAGGYYSGGYPSAAPAYEDPLAARRAHDFPAPLNGLEFQPSETCPKNYVIFDQTCTKSRVMFHPSLGHKLGGSSGYDRDDPYCYGGAGGAHDAGKGAYRDNNNSGDDSSSVRQEDTEEIDALLSSEDGDEDDVVSTGRTPGYRDGSSPDSTCSSSYGGSKPRPKKERMKKMMRTLKGIIPGGNQMDTPAVLDEAVRYLKSLKVEAKKLGVRGSDS